MTVVGDRGASLSGGQKARINLAYVPQHLQPIDTFLIGSYQITVEHYTRRLKFTLWTTHFQQLTRGSVDTCLKNV